MGREGQPGVVELFDVAVRVVVVGRGAAAKGRVVLLGTGVLVAVVGRSLGFLLRQLLEQATVDSIEALIENKVKKGVPLDQSVYSLSPCQVTFDPQSASIHLSFCAYSIVVFESLENRGAEELHQFCRSGSSSTLCLI